MRIVISLSAVLQRMYYNKDDLELTLDLTTKGIKEAGSKTLDQMKVLKLMEQYKEYRINYAKNMKFDQESEQQNFGMQFTK
jgi:hypothetical protein